MIKIIYDVYLQFVGKDTIVISGLEKVVKKPNEGEESFITEEYLKKLETTLEKIETGRNGLLRVGSEIFHVDVTNIPRISVKVIATGFVE